MTPRQIAIALGGEVVGANAILCPGPGHSPQDRSLSVHIGREGHILCHSFAGDYWQDCKRYVFSRLGLREGERPAVFSRVVNSPEATDSTERALQIWQESRPVAGTLAEAYFRTRHLLPLPPGDFVRFHPACPLGPATRLPAVVSLIRNIKTDEPQGIQRTALNRDGTAIKEGGRTKRMTLGAMAHGAIKIDASPGASMCIGEGLETCLSARRLGHSPAWALGSARGIEQFDGHGYEAITILVDNDESGRKAAELMQRKQYNRRSDCKITTVSAKIGNDFNDELIARIHGNGKDDEFQDG